MILVAEKEKRCFIGRAVLGVGSEPVRKVEQSLQISQLSSFNQLDLKTIKEQFAPLCTQVAETTTSESFTE